MRASNFQSVTTSTKFSLINIEAFKIYSWCMVAGYLSENSWIVTQCFVGDVQKARTFLPGFDTPGLSKQPTALFVTAVKVQHQHIPEDLSIGFRVGQTQ